MKRVSVYFASPFRKGVAIRFLCSLLVKLKLAGVLRGIFGKGVGGGKGGSKGGGRKRVLGSGVGNTKKGHVGDLECI